MVPPYHFAHSGDATRGVLSPTIWNLIIDEIITEVHGLGCKIVGYADDLIILANGTDLPAIRDQLQIALNKIIQWGDRNNLTFNPQKSQVLLSTRKYKFTFPDELSIKGTQIEFSTSIKYLGLLIEKSLSWHTHIKKQCTAAKKLLMTAKAAIGAEWGLTPERVRWIHAQIVRPKVTYGASVWAFNLTETDKNF